MLVLNIACLLLLPALALSSKARLSDPLGLQPDVDIKFGTGSNYVRGSLWPKPQTQNRSSDYFSISPQSFTFVSAGEQSDILSSALNRYLNLTFPDAIGPIDPALKVVSVLKVVVLNKYEPMDLSTDESYTLDIEAGVSQLTAKTVIGALRGLETFSQAVFQNQSGYYLVQRNTIYDFPRFQHRGFLIDTSRHYVALPVIYEFLDAMSYSKFNVFHWHIVDDQAFPYVSKAFPKLHLTGAWNNVTHIYTPEDVQSVIDYARLRGIRVLPEFDTPGHTQSWRVIPNLLTPCYTGGKPDGTFGPIDPTVDSNYVFLRAFFQEVAQVFPDTYIHMGGDEVDFGCWKSNPNINAWMQSHGMASNYSLLEQYYEQMLLDIIKSLDKQYVIWQEVVDNNVKVQADTVVNVWKDGWQDEMAQVTSLGYRTILSSCWYLNYISYGNDWPPYYQCDPWAFTGTQEQKELVIGGTACMWGEWVDATNLIARSWGRGLAVGERLWSDKSVTDLGDAYKRIWEHRCRYVRRGLQAENVVQSQFCYHEWRNTH